MEVVTYPHPALLRRTEPVGDLTDEVRAKIDRMLETMHASDGVGLAAPQVAWSVRLFVMNPGDDPGRDEAFIDPVILKRRGRVLGEEGCLSFPGIYVQVERAEEIEVEFTDRRGQRRREVRTGFEARIIQHEMDHLDNILLIHRMSPADRQRFKRELEALARDG